MYEIKKLNVWSFARSIAAVMLGASLVVPIAFAILIGFMGAIMWGNGGFDVEDVFEILFEEEFITFYFVQIPIVALASLGAGALGAWIYNLVSLRVGGVKMDIEFLGQAEDEVHEQKDMGH